jgi:hypothetical protein
MLEPSDKELLARRHLRAVIRERVDWHISRRDHGSQYTVHLPELSGELSGRKLDRIRPNTLELAWTQAMPKSSLRRVS